MSKAKTSVLVVERDDVTRVSLTRALHFLDMRVVAVKTVDQARDLLASHRVEVILTDDLGDAEHSQLMAIVDERGHLPPVILITAAVENRERRALEALFAVMPKPINLDVLERTVERAAGRRLPSTGGVGLQRSYTGEL